MYLESTPTPIPRAELLATCVPEVPLSGLGTGGDPAQLSACATLGTREARVG
jgi:hypothetical protein